MAYVRSADQNILANSVQMQVWESQGTGKAITLEYKEAEKALMDLLRAKTSTSLSSYAKYAGIPNRIASKIMAKFILLGVVGMNIYESGTVFYLQDPKFQGQEPSQ